MRRRELIAGLALSPIAPAPPLRARAQPISRLAVLLPSRDTDPGVSNPNARFYRRAATKGVDARR